MKLFNAYGEPGFHTTIATTFAVDFVAYEQLALARLREAGCMNNIVVADARMLTFALEDAERPPMQAGRRYSLVGAEAPGLFHPKLTLQLGADCARLIVASANLTASGLAGNLEVVGEVRMDPGDEEHAQLLRDSLAFIERFIPPAEQGARKQLEWARGRSPWLQHAGAVGGAAPAVQLLVSDAGAGIGQRFIEVVGGEPVTGLIAISPYWDEGLAAMRFLQGELRPRHTALVIQPDRGLFPGKAGLKVDVYEAGPLIKPRDRFAHAKVLIAQTRKADHVLFGSPNCTVAALGNGSKAGVNVEAALYKRMASGAAIVALGLGEVLDGQAIAEADLVPYAEISAIPLEQLSARQPGRFQLRGNQLTWTPAPAFDVPGAVLELLDGHHALQLANPPAVGEPGARVFHVEMDDVPRFARVRVGQRVSAPGVVHVEELILENLRAPKTRRIQEGLDKLAGGDIEGLFLYEALELIDAEERRIAGAPGRDRVGPRARAQQCFEQRTLTYEEFVRARGQGPSPDMTPGNSLASSHANEVRAVLNMLIGVEESRLRSQEEAVLLAMPLGLGDETGDGEEALEEGVELEVRPATGDDTAPPTPATREQDTEEAIVDAVARFNTRIADAAAQRGLTTRDLLRVRILLTILLASGSNQLYRRSATASDRRRAVLLAKGEHGWPRLVGQVLYRLFGIHGDERPLIQQINLQSEEQGSAIPVDVLECLATCFWAVGALALAHDERGAICELATRAHQRAEEMYGVTILEPADLMCAEVEKVLQALTGRYATRLGVDASALMQLHATMAAATPVLKMRWVADGQPQADEVE